MRARFPRAALTATLILGSIGVARGGEIDTFFADLDKPAPTKRAMVAATHPTGAAAASDPLGMDALFDGEDVDRRRDGPEPRIVEVLPPAPPSADGKRGDAAPPDIRTRVLAPTPEPLAAPAKEAGKDALSQDALGREASGKAPAAGKANLDPEPDAPIKPPAATPTLDPLDAADPSKAPGAGDATSVGSPAEPSAQPLPPLNAAIKATLDKRDALDVRGANARERRKERGAVAAFYAAHGFAPVWSDGGHPVAAAAPVMARLARAAEDALTLPAPPKSLTTDGALDAVAASEVALTDAVVAYARQASGARVDPRTIGPLIGAKPRLADPAAVLESIAAAGATAGDALRDFNPTEPRYVALREKLAQAREARGSAPTGPSLKVGARGARVPSHLEGTLVANMEMWRWMPRDLGQDRIEVDIPSFTVTVFRDGVPAAHNRVVVGKVDTPTPLFSNTMRYLIVNPVWNVPESIIDKDLLPKDGDASGIRARGFDVSYRNGKLVVKQPAGEKNALGRVKFMFPNDYAVYLHDTPSKALFSTSKRAYSHGCVRVDQPFDFAQSVLNDASQASRSQASGGKLPWSQERLRKLLGDKERTVNLPEPLPIHIEYFTATVDPDSQRLQLRDDVYDYAHKVAAALGEGDGQGVVASIARPTLATTHRHPRAAIASD